MFGFGKDKKDKAKTADAKTSGAKPTASKQGKNTKGSLSDNNGKSQSLAGDALRAQALANAKMARQAIGEDTLNKIAAAMHKKQQSSFEQAKRDIRNADAERVALEILSMLETRH
jgi:hypothetical protein